MKIKVMLSKSLKKQCRSIGTTIARGNIRAAIGDII
jgi:hypothetical protein